MHIRDCLDSPDYVTYVLGEEISRQSKEGLLEVYGLLVEKIREVEAEAGSGAEVDTGAEVEAGAQVEGGAEVAIGTEVGIGAEAETDAGAGASCTASFNPCSLASSSQHSSGRS